MNPPEPFEWEQRGASKVRCKGCGEVEDAVTLDLVAPKHEDCT